MLELSRPYMPVTVKGLIVHPDNPFQFDFLIDSGDTGLKGQAVKTESMKLIKYFLAALTVPENEMWVNLSPYEKTRIIPKSFGDTEMGRDLLEQDYILKQLTASLTYPEKEMGKKFWDQVYAQAQSRFGTSSILVDTFNKVWIVPSTARIYEHNNGAFVVEARLKVMLEEDYLASRKNKETPTGLPKAGQNVGASQVIREVILPELEREVNEGAHFANLRQIYQAMVLATWYKIRLKNSILGRSYVDQDKTSGIALGDKQANEKIYRQYLQAFKKGVYNYIKEDLSPSGEIVPRKYVSGGFDSAMLGKVVGEGLGATVTNAAQMAPRGDMAMVDFEVKTQASDEAMAAEDLYDFLKGEVNVRRLEGKIQEAMEAVKRENRAIVVGGTRHFRSGARNDVDVLLQGVRDEGTWRSFVQSLTGILNKVEGAQAEFFNDEPFGLMESVENLKLVLKSRTGESKNVYIHVLMDPWKFPASKFLQGTADDVIREKDIGHDLLKEYFKAEYYVGDEETFRKMAAQYNDPAQREAFLRSEALRQRILALKRVLAGMSDPELADRIQARYRESAAGPDAAMTAVDHRELFARFEDKLLNAEELSLPLKDGRKLPLVLTKGRSLFSSSARNYYIDLDVSPGPKEYFPELAPVYNFTPAEMFLPPQGTLGKIGVEIFPGKDDGRPILMVSYNQASQGFRNIPTAQQKKFLRWIEAVHQRIVSAARQSGIETIYARTAGQMALLYPGEISDINLSLNYRLPYENKPGFWQKVAVDGRKIPQPNRYMEGSKAFDEIWQYVGPIDAAMTAEPAELGTAVITGDMVRTFAVEGDRNPLHTNEEEAKKSLFKGLVSHGVLTMEMALSEIERQFPQYSVEEIEEAVFIKPVYFNNKINMAVEITDAKGGGKTFQVTIDGEDKRNPTVAKLKVHLSPASGKKDLPEVTQQERERVALLAREVTTRKPKFIYDFTQVSSPRRAAISQKISKDNIQSLQALLGVNDAQFISRAIARKMMTRALAEIIPGHAIGKLSNIHFGVSAQEGDSLTARIRIGKIDEVYKDAPKHRVNAVVQVINQDGQEVLRADVLMVMIMDSTILLSAREKNLFRRLMNPGGLIMDRRMSFMHAMDILIEAEKKWAREQKTNENFTLEAIVGEQLRKQATLHDRARIEYNGLSRGSRDWEFVNTLMSGGPKYGLVEAMEALRAEKEQLSQMKPVWGLADDILYWQLLIQTLDKIQEEDRLADDLRVIAAMRAPAKMDEKKIHADIMRVLSRLEEFRNAEVKATLKEEAVTRLKQTLNSLITLLKDQDIAPEFQPLTRISGILKRSATPEQAAIALGSLLTEVSPDTDAAMLSDGEVDRIIGRIQGDFGVLGTWFDKVSAHPELLSKLRNFIKGDGRFKRSVLEKDIVAAGALDEHQAPSFMDLVEQKMPREKDQAQLAQADPVGGIDLNSKDLDLEIGRDVKDAPLTSQGLGQVSIDGLYPVILNIQPVVNLPALLGLR